MDDVGAPGWFCQASEDLDVGPPASFWPAEDLVVPGWSDVASDDLVVAA